MRPETVVFLTSWQIQMKTVERNGMRQLKWLEEIAFSFRKGAVRNGPGFDPIAGYSPKPNEGFVGTRYK